MQQNLNALIERTRSVKLEKFDSELFSSTSLGRFMLFMHAMPERDLLLIYCPLITLTRDDYSVDFLSYLLQLNLPAAMNTAARVSLSENGRLWISLTLPLSAAEQQGLDTFLPAFLGDVENVLGALSADEGSSKLSAAPREELETEEALSAAALSGQMLWG